ncbi:MAG: hypothetical protein NTV94_13845 [Planctomycetota bacterium]|nr:hypothetical protein [Planctomycetota bacterium]
MLGAWLFLPMASYPMPVVAITKMSVTCVSVFIGTVFFDPSRFNGLRFTSTDAALIAWVLAPLLSAISAGYGVSEGVAGALNQMVSWGLPYLVGRLYFSDQKALTELAIAVFIGGLVYAPLVIFEAKMSPQLHTYVYGFHQHQFAQARRGEGWRPTVFMQHGLAVAMFMGTAAVCGLWLWLGGGLRVLLGSVALPAGRMLGTKLILWLLMSIAPVYILARTIGGWDAQLLRSIAGIMGDDRGGSLGVRLTSEEVCWRFIQSSPLLGDCRMDRLMLRDMPDERFVPDALWLIVMTKNGLFGVLALYSFLLLPVKEYLSGFRPSALFARHLCGATVAATVLALYVVDSLLNAMVNPIYLLGAGGLVGLMKSRGFSSMGPMPAR